MADPKIKYDIEAAVSGEADVNQLASRLEALAKTLDGDLKTSATDAAAALRQLGSKQTAIERFVELKQGAKDAAERLNEAQAAAQKMGQTLAATETPTRSQTGQMAKLSDAVRAAKNEVTQQNAAVMQARSALAQYGINTNNLAQSQQNVKAAVAAAKVEVNALVPAYAQAGDQAAASAKQQKQASADVSKGVANIGDQLRRIQSIAMLAVGGGFLGGLVKDALTTADTFNNLQGRIKLVTGEGVLLASSFKAVSEIALRTNTELEQTSTLFTRIAEAGKSAGLGAREAVAQALSLTETINQSIQLSSGSMDSSKAAITQLIQGLQSGVLRGEEFNSVMEQSPRLAKALADGLGRTTGELRAMANAGALTTDVVIRSLRSQADAIKAEFGSLPPTVGRAIENLRTSWTLFVGDLDKGAGISKDVAKTIDSIAGNLNVLLSVVGYAGGAWAAYAVSQKLAQVGAKLTAASTAEAAIAVTGQGAASASAALSTAAHGNAAGVAATKVAGYGAASAGAGAATAAAGAQAATAAGGWRAITGTIASAASKATLWGVVAYEGFGILKSLGTALGEGAARWMGYGDAEAIVTAEEKKLAAAAQATAEAQYKQAEATRIAKDEAFGLSKAAGDLAVKFDALVKGGDSAAEAIGKIGKDFDLSTLPGIRDAAGVLDKLLADGKLTAAQFKAAWAVALDGKDLAQFETMARAAFSGSKREAKLLADELDAGLRESIKRTGLDFDVISGGMGKASRSAINDTEAIIAGLDKLKAQGIDAAQVLTASIGKGISTADSQNAIEAVRLQIESLRKALGDKLTDGLLDQAKQKADELKDALDKATPGVNSLREAYQLLGLKTAEELNRIAATNKAAWEQIRLDGTATAETLKAAFTTYAQSAIAASGNVGSAQRAVTEETLKTQAAVKGLSISFDAAGKLVVQTQAEAAAAIDKTTESLGDQRHAVDAVTSALERQNAAQERSNAAIEKAAELARKRDNVDKQGFTLDRDGNRLSANTPTDRSTYETAKQQGLSDAQALAVMGRFWQNGKQAGIAEAVSNGSNWYVEVQKAIDQMVLANAVKAAAAGTSTPQAPASLGKVYTVNVNVGGVNTAINTSSDADAQALISVLQRAKLTSGL